MLRKAIYIPASVLMAWTSAGAAAQVPAPLREPGLRDYVVQVLQRNSALAAAGVTQRAATERIAPAGALPDPILSFGMMSVPVLSFDFEREAMTRLPIGIRQAFPFPGKQAARTAVARGDSTVAAAAVTLTADVLASQAAAAFFELTYAVSALEIWRDRVVLADQATVTATALYETGRAPQADLLRARLQRARLSEEGHRFAAEIEVAAADVDVLRGGPAEPVAVPRLTESDSAAVRAVPSDTLAEPEDLMKSLQASNPALAVAAAGVERARASAHLFSIAAMPDFVVGVQTGIRLGGREPFLSVMVGLSLPLWSGRKQSPAARASALDLEASEERFEDLRARLEGELRGRVSRLNALRARVRELTTEILPIAEAASRSALASYGTGGLDLTAVLDAQDDLFQVQLRVARLVADYGARRAALAALLGEEWYR